MPIRPLICRVVHAVIRRPTDPRPPAGTPPEGGGGEDALLMETGDYLLLESGDNILLEAD